MKIKDVFYTLLGRRREQTIAFSTILRRIWRIRKTLVKWEACGLLVGLVICFSIPKEYTTTIKLVPEKTTTNVEMDALSESVLSILMNMGDDPDAYSKKLYAILMDNLDFFYDLLDLEFEDSSHAHYKLRDLLSSEFKHPWWYYFTTYPIDLCKEYLGATSYKVSSRFMPTSQDVNIISELQKRVMLSEVERTGMLELEIQMQDPKVAAVLADTISSRLERLLADYRMAKYVNKVEYTKQRVAETQTNYHTLQDSLAFYQDCHNQLSHNVDRIKGERLRADRDIAFNVYSMSRIEEQAAEAKLLDNKSVFFTVEGARMAVKSSSPRKLVILSYVIFLCAYIPIMRELWKKTNNKK